MNKKVLLVIILVIIIIAIILVFVFANSDKNETITNQTAIKTIDNQNIEENLTNTEVNIAENIQTEGEENMENSRIKLTANGNEIFVKLDNNQASRE